MRRETCTHASLNMHLKLKIPRVRGFSVTLVQFCTNRFQMTKRKNDNICIKFSTINYGKNVIEWHFHRQTNDDILHNVIFTK